MEFWQILKFIKILHTSFFTFIMPLFFYIENFFSNQEMNYYMTRLIPRLIFEYYFIVWTMLHYYIWEECPTYVILTCHCRRICPRNNNLILLSSDPSCTGLFQDQKPSWPKIKVEKAVSSKIEDNPSGGWKHESSRYKINS